MKAIALTAAALIFCGFAAFADSFYVKQTSDGFLNVRSGPGTEFSILREIYPGDQVKVLGRNGNWLRVRLLNGPKGWVHKDYVR